MSLRGSTAAPRACSGEKYVAVPMTEPVLVRFWSVESLSALAMPKSATFTPPSRVISTLPGLTSRCTTRLRWAKPRAAAMSAVISAARSGCSRPSSRSISASVWPSTYSITMKYVPLASPQSNTLTMFGCCRLAAACASRRKRSTKPWSVARAGKSTLTATGRSSNWSRARYTSAMPPRPSRRWSSYRPLKMTWFCCDMRSPDYEMGVCGPESGGVLVSRRRPSPRPPGRPVHLVRRPRAGPAPLPTPHWRWAPPPGHQSARSHRAAPRR